MSDIKDKGAPSQNASLIDAPSSHETIDPVIEKRTMLKMDTVVLGCFGSMYLLANLDRNNLVRPFSFLLFLTSFALHYINAYLILTVSRVSRAQQTSWAFRRT
jgi:hypothetical protein